MATAALFLAVMPTRKSSISRLQELPKSGPAATIASTKAEGETVSADEPVGQSSPNAEASCYSNGVEPKRRLGWLRRQSHVVA